MSGVTISSPELNKQVSLASHEEQVSEQYSSMTSASVPASISCPDFPTWWTLLKTDNII